MFKEFIFVDVKNEHCGVCTVDGGTAFVGIIGQLGIGVDREMAYELASVLLRFAATGEVEPKNVEYNVEHAGSAVYYRRHDR